MESTLTSGLPFSLLSKGKNLLPRKRLVFISSTIMGSIICSYANNIISATKENNQVEIASKFTDITKRAARTKNIVKIRASKCLIGVLTILYGIRNESGDFKSSGYGEDTFVHNFISPWLVNIFHGGVLSRKWASSKLVASQNEVGKTFLPDFTVFTEFSGQRYDLLVLETKPPSCSNASGDQLKIAYEIQCMIDSLIKKGIEAPVVCGIWVDGIT